MSVINKIFELNRRSILLRSNIGAFTTFNADIVPNEKQMSQFSNNKDMNDIQLPLKVKGTLITAGTYNDHNYGKVKLPPSELKKTIKDWVGVQIFKSHEYFKKLANGQSVDVDGVVGKITDAQWNDNKKSIEYTGEIYNMNVARNILGGVVSKVSVGFMNSIEAKDGTYYKTAIEPKELSLVFNPKDKNATISAAG